MTDYEREALLHSVGENSARLAFAFGWATSTGSGGKAFEEHVRFGLTFIEKPVFAYGYEVQAYDPDEEYFPTAHAFVYEWIQDARGFYVGAYVAVQVDLPSPDLLEVPAPAQVEHHFTFSALAMKDVASPDRDSEDDEG